jgi:hypothetical protein
VSAVCIDGCVASRGRNQGKRFALPHSRILIHQPVGWSFRTGNRCPHHGEEILRMREMTSRIIANHSGQTFDQVEKDVERDRILSRSQAKEYGLIDEVLNTGESSCRWSVVSRQLGDCDALHGYRDLVVWQKRCSLSRRYIVRPKSFQRLRSLH